MSTYIVAGSDATVQDGVLRTGEPGALVEETVEIPEATSDEYHLALYEHLRHDAPPPVPWEHTRRVMVLLDAAFESARTGEAIRVG